MLYNKHSEVGGDILDGRTVSRDMGVQKREREREREKRYCVWRSRSALVRTTIINHQNLIESTELEKTSTVRLNDMNKTSKQRIEIDDKDYIPVLKTAQDDRKISPDSSLLDQTNFEFHLLDNFPSLSVPFPHL